MRGRDPRTYPLRRRDGAGAPRRVTTVEHEAIFANSILLQLAAFAAVNGPTDAAGVNRSPS